MQSAAVANCWKHNMEKIISFLCLSRARQQLALPHVQRAKKMSWDTFPQHSPGRHRSQLQFMSSPEFRKCSLLTPTEMQTVPEAAEWPGSFSLTASWEDAQIFWLIEVQRLPELPTCRSVLQGTTSPLKYDSIPQERSWAQQCYCCVLHHYCNHTFLCMFIQTKSWLLSYTSFKLCCLSSDIVHHEIIFAKSRNPKSVLLFFFFLPEKSLQHWICYAGL